MYFKGFPSSTYVGLLFNMHADHLHGFTRSPFFNIFSSQSTSYAYVIELDLGTPPQRVTYLFNTGVQIKLSIIDKNIFNN